MSAVEHDSSLWGFRNDIKVIEVHLTFWIAPKTATIQKQSCIQKAQKFTGKRVRVPVRHPWTRTPSPPIPSCQAWGMEANLYERASPPVKQPEVGVWLKKISAAPREQEGDGQHCF